MASDVRFPEARRMLEARGYLLHRVTGSHHVFKKPGVGSFVVPVHHGKVKAVYVKQIQKL
jgi:predicted RNA binding protein YcfA (HicA-like mRNA interferase family)